MAYPDGEQLGNVCKVAAGELQCRYLASCGAGLGWSCEKKSPLKRLIDLRVERDLQKAHGDNCDGMDWQ